MYAKNWAAAKPDSEGAHLEKYGRKLLRSFEAEAILLRDRLNPQPNQANEFNTFYYWWTAVAHAPRHSRHPKS
jgi:hypothetical protein